MANAAGGASVSSAKVGTKTKFTNSSSATARERKAYERTLHCVLRVQTLSSHLETGCLGEPGRQKHATTAAQTQRHTETHSLTHTHTQACACMCTGTQTGRTLRTYEPSGRNRVRETERARHNDKQNQTAHTRTHASTHSVRGCRYACVLSL